MAATTACLQIADPTGPDNGHHWTRRHTTETNHAAVTPARGNDTVNAVPSPTVLSTSMWPPCLCTIP